MTETTGVQRRGRIVLGIIVAIFVVPMSVAWIWYFNLERLGPPEGSTARGELVVPAQPLADFALPRVDAPGSVTLEALRGRWTIIHTGGASCDDGCRASLYDSRQARLALGKDIDRVQRLYLLLDAQEPEDARFIAEGHPDMVVARVTGAHPLRAQLAVDDPARDGHVWLVDPVGNLMMVYPPGDQGRALLDDLKRLLRLSRVG